MIWAIIAVIYFLINLMIHNNIGRENSLKNLLTFPFLLPILIIAIVSGERTPDWVEDTLEGI